MAQRTHGFLALAFEENFTLRELAPAFPGARLAPHQLHVPMAPGGDLFLFPFGAAVFRDVDAPRREAALAALRERMPRLAAQVVREEFTVVESEGVPRGLSDGRLLLDVLTPARSRVVALIVGQSAAMEYYERIVDRLFARTDLLVARLESKGTVPMRTRPLHRFIGEAVGVRNEVLSVLHLLDKPDETWDDPAMDEIYADLRAEFDLADRWAALESKQRGMQEALELLVDVARDRRLFLLEAAVVLLIVLEVVLSVVRH